MVDEKSIKKIIFITLTNLGDVVATLPSLDYLKNRFKNAVFTVVSGPNTSSLFQGDPRISEYIPFNKHASWKENFMLFNHLRKQDFDVIIDLRDTTFRWFAKARFKNPYFNFIPKTIKHIRLKHLYKTLAAFGDRSDVSKLKTPQLSIFIDDKSKRSAIDILKKYNISLDSEYIIVAPGARSLTKRWHKEGFVSVSKELIKHYSIIFVGDKNDLQICSEINIELDNRGIVLAGQTNLIELIVTLKNAKLVICNDSGLLHIASYLDLPLLAIFGPTDENKTGPYSKVCAVARKNMLCSPCVADDCKNNWCCMRALSAQHVIDYANEILAGRIPIPPINYRRILISRTDKMGDLLLSTPIIKNLRERLPGAYIAISVQSHLKDVVRGNPYLDEAILFDNILHKGLFGSIKFANLLRSRKFDLAIILTPKKRTHLLLFLSGIKERLGYDIKWGFLNTHIVKHTKQLGEKHETEYVLDLLRELGINGNLDNSMFMPVYKDTEEWAEQFFKQHNLIGKKVVVIHPQAGYSKLWPLEYYDELVSEIIDIYKATVIYVGERQDIKVRLGDGIINLFGETSLSQFASILKRASLFISNDSGPVQMAAALNVPVIVIYGRKEPGIAPKRWKPLGENSMYIQKDVGCQVCLTDNCKNDFACLKAILPDDVLGLVDKILSK